MWFASISRAFSLSKFCVSIQILSKGTLRNRRGILNLSHTSSIPRLSMSTKEFSSMICSVITVSEDRILAIWLNTMGSGGRSSFWVVRFFILQIWIAFGGVCSQVCQQIPIFIRKKSDSGCSVRNFVRV